MIRLLTGPGFTYLIISLYALRCVTYAIGGHWGRAAYWVCALGITVSAEFLIKRWP